MAAIHLAGVRGEPCGAGLFPDDDLLRSKHVGVPLNNFMYFNIEINIIPTVHILITQLHHLFYNLLHLWMFPQN